MKKALALALALATAISLSACGGGNKTPAASGSTSTAAPTGGDASIVLKVAHVEAEDRSTHKALLAFEKQVEEKSDAASTFRSIPTPSWAATRSCARPWPWAPSRWRCPPPPC